MLSAQTLTRHLLFAPGLCLSLSLAPCLCRVWCYTNWKSCEFLSFEGQRGAWRWRGQVSSSGSSVCAAVCHLFVIPRNQLSWAVGGGVVEMWARCTYRATQTIVSGARLVLMAGNGGRMEVEVEVEVALYNRNIIRHGMRFQSRKVQSKKIKLAIRPTAYVSSSLRYFTFDSGFKSSSGKWFYILYKESLIKNMKYRTWNLSKTQ